MIVLAKLLIILAVLGLLAYPLLPLSKKMKRISTCRSLRYDHPENRKNFVFVLVAAVETVFLCAVIQLLSRFGNFLMGLPLLDKLFAAVSDKLSDQAKYIITVAVMVVIVNLIALYVFVILKAFVKKLVMEYALLSDEERMKRKEEKKKQRLEKKKNKKNKKTPKTPEEEEDDKKKTVPTPDPVPSDTTPVFPRVKKPKTPEEEDEDDPDDLEGVISWAEGNENALKPRRNRFLGLFFEGDHYEYALPWVHRVTAILQLFLILTEVLYFTFFFALLLAVFFPLPEGFYGFLRSVTENLYIYPFVSIIFLQELVNTFKAPVKEGKLAKDVDKKKKDEDKKSKEVDLEKLHKEILSSYGEEHCIRFFPALDHKKVNEYDVTNKTYAPAIRYIAGQMKLLSGRVVQRYLEGIDALFNNTHISFAASFYSELGEYLITYTYTRLLAGERQLFIVSDKSRVKPLKQYISERLMALTGCTEEATWQVLTVDDKRLVQADVLIACPEDFKSDDIIEHSPDFFEEACNAIFVDADRILTLDSYLCPIMAVRLQQATQGRIRFVFLSRNILHGFANSLRKFFCINEVLDYSSLEENEKVSYYLWNRESTRIYQGREQRTTAVESKIAALSADYGVDGVRVLTESPFDNVEKKELIDHRVEFNEFHKTVPEINYLVTTDEGYNLASAIYGYTRFRGKKESILHIVSKPYLLREYFMAHIERYVNRSSFIQPRVTEHACDRKISLLRIFCEASAGAGMVEEEFTTQMHSILSGVATCASLPLCPFCEKLEQEFNKNGSLTTLQYAAYVIAGLLDNENTPEKLSEGNRVHDYFVYTNEENRSSAIKSEITRVRFGKIRSVFERVLCCNERVALRLHDTTIGMLDTFPTRVKQQYQPGQTILYNNRVYEISSISADGSVIYLRQESITDVKYLDTVPIRRYLVNATEKLGDQPHRVTFTRGNVSSIELWRMRADVEAETYAYHWLVTDSQVLDFVKGVSGDKLISAETVEKEKRAFKKSPLLSLSIKASEEGGKCSDRMRMLLAAVFNEFIRTIFPDAYRCIVVCPVLAEPLSYENGSAIVSYEDHVKTVYPYLKKDSSFTTEDNEIRLLIINDCSEDIGVLDLLYNSAASLIQEFLTNIYGYLYWLKQNPSLAGGQKHYIYFGADKLPEVYDLESCCRLLKGFNKIFSDGKTDSMTVIEEDEEEELYCTFCHEKLERGRHFYFNHNSKKRRICMDCLTRSVDDASQLEKLFEGVKKYWEKTFEGEALPEGVTVALDSEYVLENEPFFNENFSRIDRQAKKIMIECAIPSDTAQAAMLQGLLAIWQSERNLEISYARAQRYYEELLYLLSLDKAVPTAGGSLTPEQLRAAQLYLLLPNHDGAGLVSFDPKMFDRVPLDDGSMPEDRGLTATRHIISLLDADLVAQITELCEYILENGITDKRTSFTFLQEKSALISSVSVVDDVVEDDDTTEDGLFDPDDIPRFWKIYLRGHKASTYDFRLPTELSEKTDDTTEVTDETEVTEEEKTEETKGKKAPKKPKKTADEKRVEKDRKRLYGKIKTGMELCPKEKDEDTNPKIRLYNEIVRHIADIDSSWFEIPTMPKADLDSVYAMVRGDYPELFWLDTYYFPDDKSPTISKICLGFRCLTSSGKVDYEQIRIKREAIRKAAKPFLKGITRKTDPYKAVQIIYRRLILTLDYDGVGLDAGVDEDITRDDSLRSLYSALVDHKVVCAGYAVAMQYLLHAVGIPCAYVISEKGISCCHAFNLFKIGKECYYLDATWGDRSDTKDKYSEDDKDKIFYNYFCTPIREFKMVNAYEEAKRHDLEMMHTPRRAYYPTLEDMMATRLEHHRARGSYFDRYDENKIKQALIKQVKEHDEKTMGEFMFHFRCPDAATTKQLIASLLESGAFYKIISAAKEELSSKEAKLLKKRYAWYPAKKDGHGRPIISYSGAVTVVFTN
ncbi:MAG: hypothetical protein IJW46_02495 [Clostridia bacterium]|nr:hypothetical protein [Clostridia bacterium]